MSILTWDSIMRSMDFCRSNLNMPESFLCDCLPKLLLGSMLSCPCLGDLLVNDWAVPMRHCLIWDMLSAGCRDPSEL